MDNSRFFANEKCPYFPCHKNAEDFSCLFCYCPLYALGEGCGGDFIYTADGIKDCSACLIPHERKNYDMIIEKSKLLTEMVRRK